MGYGKVGAALAGAIAAFMTTTGGAKAEDFPDLNLKFALYIAENTVHGKIYKWWGEEIGRRSGGKIKVTTFFSESLGKSTELLELVAAGAVNFTAPSPGYYASKLPLVNVGQLPLVMSTNDEVHAVMDAIAETTAIKKEQERNKVVPLFWTSLPTYHVLCNTEIKTVADFANKKMRSYGAYVPQMWSALNAVSVTVLLPEIYEGLQRGNIDCSYLPDDVSYSYKLHEVAKYYVTANFGTIMAWPVYANAAQWNAWPDSVKALIMEVSKEASERDRVEVAKFGEESASAMLAGGMTKVEFQEQEKLEATIPDFVDVWVERMKGEGMGAEAEEIATMVRKATKAPD
ncbi:MAG: TRAP transporter substrate-binding protein DctP [Rhizobiaceae bacterium]|nr:TRAP transporter substrate-binding protein DctP [Rhizobiaceae bacterium]